MSATTRVLVLLTNALLCASLAGLVALYALGKALPASDGAYGMSVWESLGDPFILSVWLLRYTVLSVGQLKILQEVITLSVFVPFAVLYLKEPLKLDYLWAGLCILGAVYFIFRSRWSGA